MQSESKHTEAVPEKWGPYRLQANPLAILKLSLGTAASIATFLVIPDILQMLFSAPDALALVLRRSTALWFYAYILWASGFLCILHLLRIFGSAILIDSEGIKLGRMDKKLLWQNLRAVNVVERKLFSRLFFIPSYQMTIHYLKKDGKAGTKQIASFLYQPQEFFSLFHHICRLSTTAQPASLHAFVFKDASDSGLSKLCEEGKLKRLALSVLICFGLVSFLGRKAVVNYNYNMGNREFNSGNYAKAASHYLASTSIDFAFGPGWDGLARSELRLGDSKEAEEHWREALKWKPDFVESKLGLSRICMLQGRLEEADKLVNSAARLAPLDEAVYINRAQLDSLMGNNKEAIRKLETFINQKVGRPRALCILARCYIKEGEYSKAISLIDEQIKTRDPYSEPFFLMLKVELALAKGETAEAAANLKPLRYNASKDPELLILFAKLAMQEANFSQAQKYIDKAAKINKYSPWIMLSRAELDRQMHGNRKQESKTDAELSQRAMENINNCIAYEKKHPDACLLAACAELLEKSGNKKQAAALLEKALLQEPGNKKAAALYSKLQEASKL